MKKTITMILGSIVALTLTMSAAFSAANEVRVAFFLEYVSYELHLALVYSQMFLHY